MPILEQIEQVTDIKSWVAFIQAQEFIISVNEDNMGIGSMVHAKGPRALTNHYITLGDTGEDLEYLDLLICEAGVPTWNKDIYDALYCKLEDINQPNMGDVL